ATRLSYVQDIATIVDYVWQSLIIDQGWSPPPSDCGEGGDSRFDIYLLDSIGQADVRGYAVPEVIIGDNPNTPNIIEHFAGYSYLVMDNDIHSKRSIRSTLAHEFHHNIQFGYDANDPYMSIYESGAVWMQHSLFPNDTSVMGFDGLLLNPDLCLGTWQ